MQRRTITFPAAESASVPLREAILTMVQAVADHPSDYDVLLRGLHDALVGHARFEEEFIPGALAAFEPGPIREDLKARWRNDVARKRFVAHEITKALEALADFDRRYPT